MSRLDELTTIFRSKNAGPFLITVDIVFSAKNYYTAVKQSGILNSEEVARRYGIGAEQVRIFFVDSLLTVKITVPRSGASSGAPGDRDVYGAQQHGPLLDLEVPGDLSNSNIKGSTA
jgi:hypothetical protein